MGEPGREAKNGNRLHAGGQRGISEKDVTSSAGQTALSVLATCLTIIHTS